MSLWQDSDEQSTRDSEASMCDVHFRIECERLPVDHAFALYRALYTIAPWLEELPNAGVHTVHVAASQNGWERPELSDNADLLLSRRTRLKIRIDSSHAQQLIDALSSKSCHIAGNTLRIVSGQQKVLVPAATLFSRYTIFASNPSTQTSESEFVDAAVEWCHKIGFTPTKLLCGKSHSIASEQGTIVSRSIMLADVPPESSLRLQEAGLGSLRKMGCGILIPHKDTGAVHTLNQQSPSP